MRARGAGATIVTMLTTDPVTGAAGALRRTLTRPVRLAGEEGYDDARAGWNTAADRRPALVAAPADAAEVAAVVRFARAHGLRVAVQATGHGARPGDGADGAVLVRTEALRGVEVDARTGVARVAAGEPWHRVVAAAGPERAAPHGSSADVGVVGSTLHGGLGWLARRHGLAANAVRAVELVTAAGAPLRADAEHHPEVFWALRGGGQPLGVVTAIELALPRVSDLSAGALLFDLGRAPAVLRAWRSWTRILPPSVTSVVRLLRMPDAPAVPDLLRGRRWCAVLATALDRPGAADALVAPLRALGPEIDTFAPAPLTALPRLAMDPPGPLPSTGTSLLLDALPDDALDALLAVAGPSAETPLPVVEVRHLGGALADPAPGGGALSALPGEHLVFATGLLTPAAADATEAQLDRLERALAPWDSGRRYPAMCQRPVDPATAFRPAAWSRLRAVRAALDPDGLLIA
jgi:FAD/FMN-containing dehydrogenase